MNNTEQKADLQMPEKYGFEIFMVTNFWLRKRGVYLDKNDCNKMLNYIELGNDIPKKFFLADKEVQEYCLKYGIFLEKGVSLVCSLCVSKDKINDDGLSIDSILKKCKNIITNVGEPNEYSFYDNFSFAFNEYCLGNFSVDWLNKIMDFADYDLLDHCLSLLCNERLIDNNFALKYFESKKGEDFLNRIPWLRYNVTSLVCKGQYDKLVELLYDKKSRDGIESRFSKDNRIQKMEYSWLKTVRYVNDNIDDTIHREDIFAAFWDLCIPYCDSLDFLFDFTVPFMESYCKDVIVKKKTIN